MQVEMLPNEDLLIMVCGQHVLTISESSDVDIINLFLHPAESRILGGNISDCEVLASRSEVSKEIFGSQQ